MKGRTNIVTATLAALVFGALAVGCGTETGSGPVADAGATWKVVFDVDGFTLTDPEVNRPETQTGFGAEGPDSVTISWGAAMIRSVRLVKEATGTVDTNITAEDQSRDNNDPNIQFKGPYVLSVDGQLHDLGTSNLVPGSYEEVVFVLQAAAAGDAVGDFTDLIGHSVVVAGKMWHNGYARHFTFKTDYSAEFAVRGNFDLTSGRTHDFELRFDAKRWFRSGVLWLDPTDPANQGRIVDNIRRNIFASETVSG